MDVTEVLLKTALHDAHVSRGARMVPFAGYDMPVHYATGVAAEHLHTRTKAGLFDVSHMGIAYLRATDGSHETVAAALEALVPADIAGLAPGQQRYTQLTTDDGGIIDDLMVARSRDQDHSGWLYLVVNAARKATDYAHISARLPPEVELLPSEEFALLALQGPEAENVLATHDESVRAMPFMTAAPASIAGLSIHLTRSGYTGEDGFELPVPIGEVERVWSALLDDDRVLPIGLGARDSLRLEAGLCLYGNDIDETTSPVEAGLTWSIGKGRRSRGGFPGADRIQHEIAEGVARKRIGLVGETRAPMRAGTQLFATDEGGDPVGHVTSGGFGPSREAAISMGYVMPEHSAVGTRLFAEVRGKRLAATVSRMPFVPARYKR
ncbi:MAG: glycine cleavage system aminomethyltransferase GcvT [Hyphomicrobiaceae bacterium]